MWDLLDFARPGLVAGISAVPSIHVAISVWIFLAARTMAPRAAPYAFLYVVFIWIASVQLGWHYVIDGLLGMLRQCSAWVLGSRLQRCLEA